MIVIVMGVSGTGKTTVGRELARAIPGEFFDADDFHSPENIEKMRRGEPLNERDRERWLDSLRGIVDRHAASDTVAVLACSALTKASRRRLGAGHAGVRLVFLTGPAELIASRMRNRPHFMPTSLLESQLAALEPPGSALELDIRRPAAELAAEIKAKLAL